jgi:hypothetical protein
MIPDSIPTYSGNRPSIGSDSLPPQIPTVQSSGNRHLILKEHQSPPATRHLSPLSRHPVPTKKNADTNPHSTILRNHTPEQRPLLLILLLYHQNQPPILPILRTAQLRHATLPVPATERAAMVCTGSEAAARETLRGRRSYVHTDGWAVTGPSNPWTSWRCRQKNWLAGTRWPPDPSTAVNHNKRGLVCSVCQDRPALYYSFAHPPIPLARMSSTSAAVAVTLRHVLQAHRITSHRIASQYVASMACAVPA